MPVKTVVVSSDSNDVKQFKYDGYEVVDTFTGPGDLIGLKIDEIVNSISDSLKNSIKAESELTIEISGSVSLKGEAGVKWLLFNVGGGATKSDSLKVVFKTKILPISHG